MKRLVLFAALLAASAVSGAFKPFAVLRAASTNLVVTEYADVSLHLYLAALDEPYADETPYHPSRPPHVTAEFLKPDWSTPVFAPVDLRNAANAARRGRNVPAFTLNDYVSNSIFDDDPDPFSLFGGGNPFERLGPRRIRFPFSVAREKIDGTFVWHFAFRVPPMRALKPGRVTLGPVVVRAPLIAAIRNGRASLAEKTLRAPALALDVAEPPAAGRPAAYVGAVASNLAAAATLDASVCTAGDPLLFTLEIVGAANPSDVHPPAFPDALKKAGFRLDKGSLKSDTRADARRFTWRLRALKPGTLEFPPLDVAYFDLDARAYRTCRTAPIPVQVKAGRQVALAGGEDDADDDVFPLPDGLDLDFPTDGNARFTLDRAFALALRAENKAAFAQAADAYADWLAGQFPGCGLSLDALKDLLLAPTERLRLRGRHFANLGALRLMAEDARAAEDAFKDAERAMGATPSTLRGLRAANARLKGDPRAELPLPRLFAPFWFRLALREQILAGAGLALALVLLFVFAARAGRRLAVVALAFGLAGAAQAQFSFNFSGFNSRAASVKAAVRLEPAEAVVDEPCAFVVTFTTDGESVVQNDSLRIGGLPDEETADVEYGPVETVRENVLRIPVRFLAAYKGVVTPVFEGMAGTVRRSRFGTSSFSSNFRARAAALALDVKPLPTEGRPPDYFGAVGRDFRLRQKITPAEVRPGDLVTATYELTFYGHFPTNALPLFGAFPPGFKIYDVKETARTRNSVSWKQVLVAETTNAVRSAALTIPYYDVAAKKYRLCRAAPAALKFISAEAASIRNETVAIDAAPTPAADHARELRFAPHANSPVIAVLPPGTPAEETARRGMWRRLVTRRAVGWTRD